MYFIPDRKELREIRIINLLSLLDKILVINRKRLFYSGYDFVEFFC